MSRQQVVNKENVKSLTPPSKYMVILHNDNYTIMDFVIDVLMRFFEHDENKATQIMLNVHQEGRGVLICPHFSGELF